MKLPLIAVSLIAPAAYLSAATLPLPACSDGADNDADGLVDWQYDPGCVGPGDDTEGGASGVLERGFTVFEPSVDTRIAFLSSSDPNRSDTACQSYTLGQLRALGGNYASIVPCATATVAASRLRDGYPDWLLIKRGDVWNGAGLGTWSTSGRSAAEPMLIATYGASTQRPRFLTGSAGGWSTPWGPSGPIAVNNVALTGVHLNADTFSPTTLNDGPTAVDHKGSNFLLEDCKLENYGFAVIFGAGASATAPSYQNLRLRRNVINRTGSNSFYVTHSDGAVIEENILYQYAMGPNAHHAMYITRSGNTNVTTRANIVSTGKNVGNAIMQRPGGVIEHNFINASGWTSLALSACNDGPQTCINPVDAVVRHNVVLNPNSGSLGGIAAQYSLNPGAQFIGNILANRGAGGGAGISLSRPPADLRLEDNFVYNWNAQGFYIAGTGSAAPNNLTLRNNDVQNHLHAVPLTEIADLASINPLVVQGNRWYSDLQPANGWFRTPGSMSFSQWAAATLETGSSASVSYPDPSRSLASYNASIGGQASDPAFFAQALNQSRLNWNEALTAYAINDYIRAGFGLPPLAQNPPPAITVVSPPRVANVTDAVILFRGTDFRPGAVLLVEGVPYSFSERVDATTIRALLPAGTPPAIYQVQARNVDGTTSNEVSVHVFAPVPSPGKASAAAEIRAAFAYPNPSLSANVTVAVELSAPQEVRGEIYNVAGQKIAQLPAFADVVLTDGSFKTAASLSTANLPSGVYRLVVKAGDARKVINLGVVK